MRECATDLGPEMTEPELQSLLNALSKARFAEVHLEIGTAAGGTLCRLMQFYQEKDTRVPLFMVVDPMQYFPNQFEVVGRNLKENGIDPDEIEFLKSSSAEAFRQKASSSLKLSFILVDGNHKIRYVTEDLRWARFLEPGGLLCLHDHTPRFPGVCLNVKRLLRKHPNYEILSQTETLLILKKTRPSDSLEISVLDQFWATCLGPWFQLKASIRKRLKRSRVC